MYARTPDAFGYAVSMEIIRKLLQDPICRNSVDSSPIFDAVNYCIGLVKDYFKHYRIRVISHAFGIDITRPNSKLKHPVYKNVGGTAAFVIGRLIIITIELAKKEDFERWKLLKIVEA